MASRSRLFSKIAKDVDVTGNLTAAAISSDVSFGASVYDSTGVLPYVGNTTGDQAYVKDNNRFYIWDSAGWYNVALINRAPTITSVLDSDGASSPFALSIDGTPTTITITATDSDGDPITYSAVTDANFDGLASITGSGNEFTITPYSSDSATTESGTITFKATDGINISSNISTFTLNFLSALWDKTVLSIGTSSTNSLNNSTFIDRSTNAHTVTSSGSPVQTAFHPYLDNWSANFTGDGSFLSLAIGSDFHFDTGDYTVEAWVNPTDVSGQKWIAGIWSYTGPGNQAWALYLSGGKWRHNIDPADTIINTSTSDAVANVWTHVAIVRDGDAFKLFVNGVLESNVTSAGYNMQEGGGYVGIGQIENAPVADNWRGQIADLHVIKGYAKYTSNFTPSTELITPHANTVLLTCRRNRFYDESGTNKSISLTGSGVRVAGFSPYGGQLSEYTVGENKGSFYNSASLNSGVNYISTPTQSFAGELTIEGWVYIESLEDTYNTFFCMFREGSAGILIMPRSNNQIHVNFSGSAINTSGTVSLNEWTHIAVTRNSSDVVTCWINGVSAGTFTKSGTIVNSANEPCSFAVSPEYGASRNLIGYFSDCRIYNGTCKYTSTFSLPTSPVGADSSDVYLTMDNPGIFDKTGNNTLALVGNTSTSTTQTKFADTAMYFDGNDWISWNSPSIGSGDFTMEGWFYLSGTAGQGSAGQQGIFCAGNHGGSSKYSIKLHNTTPGVNKVMGFWLNSYTNEIRGSTVINTNQWYHYALVRSGSGSNNVKLYLDGTLEAQTTSTYSIPADTGSIGRNYPSLDAEYFNGYLENIQLLSGIAKYTANFTPPTQTQGRTYQAED